MAREADASRAEILRFWRTAELFSPQKVPKANREKRVFTVRPGEPLPWEPGHELARQKLRSNLTWRHVVYLGIYRLDSVFEVLSRAFAPDSESYDERPAGESAVAAFVVGANGFAVLDSEVLSSCAWATGQVLREGRNRPDLLSGFETATAEFSSEWRDLVSTTDVDADWPEDAERPNRVEIRRLPYLLNAAVLEDCLAAAMTAAGIGPTVVSTKIRIHSLLAARRTAGTAGGHEFLNSFITEDLNQVAERTAKGDISAALHEYLRPAAEIPIGHRIDVRSDLDAVRTATAPDAVPAGRWPSHPEHPLALNQQLAVCTAMRMAEDGVLGVNGPPGTGKTTMLRDLIAALVVERARRLAALKDPRRAFADQELRWRTRHHNRVVRPLRQELTGFEMVVASTNNGAVQNVTDEIPAAEAIDGSWRERAAVVDYFPEIATALLAPDADDGQPAESPAARVTGRQTAWALVAARLGNKDNCSRFVSAWYHDPEKSKDDQSWYGLQHVLKAYGEAAPEQPWSAAVAEFRAAEARESAVRAERSAVQRDVEHRARVLRTLAERRRSVDDAAERIEQARRAQERHAAAVRADRERRTETEHVVTAHEAEARHFATALDAATERVARARQAEADRIAREHRAQVEQVVRSWETELNLRWQAHAQHRQIRPGLWQRISTLGEAGRRWSEHDRWLAEEVRAARDELDAAHRAQPSKPPGKGFGNEQLEVPRQELAQAERRLAQVRRALASAEQRLARAERELARAGSKVDAAVRARAECEQAVRACEAELAAIDRRLGDAAAALGRHIPDTAWWQDRERRELAALWTDQEWNLARSELFLAALQLHKTFLRHSAAPMLRNLQAAMDLVSGEAPNDLSGESALAAWQSLFFVVPVVSTTFASYARLFRHLGKESLGWLLIDEAGQATPQNAVGALWRSKRAVVVGDPLQLEPITTLPFRAEQAIRNELGVDEQWSVSGSSVQHLADRLTPLGTWLPAEDGKIWVGVPLTVHRRCDQPMFDIVNRIAYDGLMIDGTSRDRGQRFTAAYPQLPPSKWIDVVSNGSRGHWIPEEGHHLDRILGTLAELGLDMSEVMVIGPFRDVANQLSDRSSRHRGLKAGTIHTAQGKQADIVVLVLGSDPNRPGARGWAARKPNLVNVAVSRAKRRLYVIGNRALWSRQPHFGVLAANLPHTRPIQP